MFNEIRKMKGNYDLNSSCHCVALYDGQHCRLCISYFYRYLNITRHKLTFLIANIVFMPSVKSGHFDITCTLIVQLHNIL